MYELGKRGRDNKMMKSDQLRSRAVELKVKSEAVEGRMILNNWATKADPVQC